MTRLIATLIAVGLAVPSLAMATDGDAVRVAFIRAKEDANGVFHGTLYVQTIGGAERRITSDKEVNAGGPRWSPDGAKIGFSDLNVNPDGSVFSIAYIADFDSGTIVNTGVRGALGGISAEHIAFSFIVGVTSWVGVARHDGSERVDLASHASGCSLSSDGSRVAFLYNGERVDIINRDGSGRWTIVENRENDIIAPVRPLFAGNDRYVVYTTFHGEPGRDALYVFARNIETGETTDLGKGGLEDVVDDWIVMGVGNKRRFAVSLDGKTRFEIPWTVTSYAAFHGDLSTLAPSSGGGGDSEPRAVYATGKLPTTWAELKTR